MISRNTEWRQGGALTQDSSYTLNLFEQPTSDKRAIIISHDCDLANEQEEHVEVIIGSIVAKAEPSYSQAKHVRRLHLTYNTISSCPVCIELTHSQRRSLPKAQFNQLAKPDLDLTLSFEEKHILKQWLVARYGRPAFPDAFEERLRKDKKFEQKLADRLKPHESHLIGVFFDLGEDRSIELPPETPYSLRISVVYNAVNGPVARKAAEECANNIVSLFHKTFDPPNIATELALESCQAVADTTFSLADIRKVDQWRTQYISLRENPPGAFLSAGETPI